MCRVTPERFVEMSRERGWEPVGDDIELFTAGSLDAMREVLKRQGWPAKASPPA